MKRRGSPAIKYGSSGSVTETGAQQGKSSSMATIRQTEGNGQEKSSGRASAENVGKIERRSPPSFNGSSNSVDETGARRGKSSSTVTIRQTEGNSQEKSSGRARDTTARRRMSAEERKNTPPKLGDADTVFADGNEVSTYVDVDADGNPVTVIKTAKALFDGAPKSAYASIAKKLIMKKYAGQTLPLGKNDLVRITKASGGEYGYPSNTLPTNSEEYNAKMRASAELHNLLENSTYDHWAADKKNHAEATLGFDYYKTVFIVDGKVFEGLINIANSENGRVFYDITNIKEVPDYTRKYAAPLARSSSAFGKLYMATIRQTEGNSQEKSSGRAGVEVSGINNRTATELDGADTVFADGSISVLSEEARYEILKDRTIRPASVEYDKLGDTDTAAIYDSLSAAQMAQAKKAIPSHCEEAGAASGRSEKQPDRISVPILQRECRRKCAASERVRRTLYDSCNDKNKGIRRRKKAPSRRKRRGHFSAIGSQHQHTGYLPECQGRRRTISEVCTGRLSEQ